VEKYYVHRLLLLILTQWAKSPKRQSEGVHFLLIRYSKYNAVLSKIHSYRLLFLRFCPLGIVQNVLYDHGYCRVIARCECEFQYVALDDELDPVAKEYIPSTSAVCCIYKSYFCFVDIKMYIIYFRLFQLFCFNPIIQYFVWWIRYCLTAGS